MALRRWQEVPPPGIDEFVEGPGLALVEFWVPWSGASFLVGTAVERVTQRRTDLPLRVGRVNADAHPDICERYRAPRPPVLLLFRDGALLARHQGLITEKDLSDWLSRSLSDRAHSTTKEDPS